jgi:hypothetical protein
MEKLLAVFYILIVVLCFSCKKENSRDCFKAHGDDIIETVDLAEYHVIQINGHVDVTLKPNQRSGADITGGKNILPLIKCDVIDDTLFIDNTNTCNWVRSYDRVVNITLYVDTLTSIVNRSTGKLSCIDTIYCATTFTLRGKAMNGETNLSVVANQVNATYINGTSTIYIDGRANIASFYCSSVGNIEASELIANETRINHKGTGEINVYSSTYLHGQINNTGNVYYSGAPKIISVEELSSGQLLQK